MSSRTRLTDSSWLSRWGRPACIAVVAVASVLLLAMWNSQSIRLLSVDSQSMAPIISKGDAVVVKDINPIDIRKGDVVSYRSLEDSSVIVTHRVLLADPQTGQLITKGDANTALDPAINSSQVTGRVLYAMPSMGHIINILHSWPGLVLLIYLPAALLLMSELWRLGKYYLRPTYVLHQRRY